MEELWGYCLRDHVALDIIWYNWSPRWQTRRKHGVWWSPDAIKLFSCLFVFSFSRIFATTWYLLFRVFEDQVCLWFVWIIFLPNLKETVPFQFIQDSHSKQKEINSFRKFHVKLGATNYSELRFRDNMFSCKARKVLSKLTFNSRPRQLLWARSWRLGLAPMSLSSPSCNFIRPQKRALLWL